MNEGDKGRYQFPQLHNRGARPIRHRPFCYTWRAIRAHNDFQRSTLNVKLEVSYQSTDSAAEALSNSPDEAGNLATSLDLLHIRDDPRSELIADQSTVPMDPRQLGARHRTEAEVSISSRPPLRTSTRPDPAEALFHRLQTDVHDQLNQTRHEISESMGETIRTIQGMDSLMSFQPKPFTGTVGEDIESWLDGFERFLEYREMPTRKAVTLCKLLLQQGAADWLATADLKTGSYQELKAALIERFGRSAIVKHRTAQELFQRKQLPHESVDTYVAQMTKMGKSLGKLNDQMTMYAVMGGLKSHVATFVAQQQPKNMKELLDQARLAELTAPPQDMSNINAAVALQLCELQQEVKRMSDKMVTSCTTQVRQEYGDRQRGFAGGQRYQGGQRWSTAPAPAPPTAPAPVRFRFSPPATTQQQQQQRQPADTSSDTTTGGTTRPAAQECSRCGRRAHSHPNFCPSINKPCNFCGRLGHFIAKCRQAARNSELRAQDQH